MSGREEHGRGGRSSPTVVDVLGVPVRPLRWPDLRDEVLRRIAARQRTTITYANVHVVNVARRDRGLLQALRTADLVYCDGEGVRLGARILGDHLPERMTGADFVWDLARALAEVEAPLFWLGGAPGVAAAAVARLAARTPGLRVAGTHDGFFSHDGAGSQRVVDEINAAAPALLMVGMGTPLQERWVAEHRDRIDAPVVWCIGATADFVAGIQRRGPALLTDGGLEWLARLASDPRRLFGRYVLGNPLFIARALAARARRAARGEPTSRPPPGTR